MERASRRAFCSRIDGKERVPDGQVEAFATVEAKAIFAFQTGGLDRRIRDVDPLLERDFRDVGDLQTVIWRSAR